MSEEKIVIPIERRLKDCPFCGGKAVLNHGHIISATGQCLANVKCSECGIASRVVWSTDSPEEAVKEAIEAWNRRAERTAKAITVMHPVVGSDRTIAGTSCENCGNIVNIFDNYCPGCGAKLDWSDDE